MLGPWTDPAPADAAWRRWLGAHGARPGDRIVCALPPGPAFVSLLRAALDASLTFVPVAPAADLAAVAAAVAPWLVVAPAAAPDVPAPVVVPDTPAGPAGAVRPPAATDAERTPDVRFLLQTSGTTGARRWIALSAGNVAAVLASHRHAALGPGDRALSVLPWHHAFGLVIELLPALARGATIVRDPDGGRDGDALVALGRRHAVTHLHAVPHTVARLAAAAGGDELLARLRGGVVGGAPVHAAVCDVLRATRLRVGYGQTEAAPGITLGEPGEWRPGILGRPVGCEVRLDADDVLAFRGPNACLGEWRDGGLHREAPDRWVRTGDLAHQEADGGYTFAGRLADSFKLSNGRFVPAGAIERDVRARFPAVVEVVVSSPDGERLIVACSAAAGMPAALPTAAELRSVLGALAGRLLAVVDVPLGDWTRTPKGEIDRRQAGRLVAASAARAASMADAGPGRPNR